MIKRVLKDPLLHFLVLGGLVFVLYGYINGGFDSQKITISKVEVDQLTYRFQKKNFRKPTPKELEKMVESAVYIEVMSREATKIGLDKNDHIIKRRLVQKMEFVSSDLSRLSKPTKEELQKYLEQNSATYQKPTEISFISIYIDPSKGNAKSRAESITHQLKDIDYTKLSDHFMLPLKYDNITYKELSRKFGKSFSQKISTLTTNTWSEPIESGYGLHLVYISKKVDGELPTVDSIKNILTNKYMEDNQEKSNQNFYKMLRDNYTVEVAK
jgi:parvulin-like peptidyl-prolyl isomerase